MQPMWKSPLRVVILKHISWYTQERPYKCSQCDEAFTQYGSLKEHLKTNTGRDLINAANVTRFSCRISFSNHYWRQILGTDFTNAANVRINSHNMTCIVIRWIVLKLCRRRLYLVLVKLFQLAMIDTYNSAYYRFTVEVAVIEIILLWIIRHTIIIYINTQQNSDDATGHDEEHYY